MSRQKKRPVHNDESAICGCNAGIDGEELSSRQSQAVERLKNALPDSPVEELDTILWETLVLFQGRPFFTAKKLEFSYVIKGNEMFVTRKDKSITRASVLMAFHKALELGRVVAGPKKLGTFGASYLYPVFMRVGVIDHRIPGQRNPD